MSRAAPPPVKLSVVIPARNAADTLPEQLAALAAQRADFEWEVLVVDNLSTDSTPEVVDRWSDRVPNLSCVRCERPGPNAARNAGIRAAAAERIVLCDADDVVDPDWLGAMDRALDEADLVGGYLDCDRLNDHFIRQIRDNPTSEGLVQIYWHLSYAVSANMGMHRAVFETLDGFDEAFAVGADEIDFCWRAQLAGFRIAFAPDAVVAYRFKTQLRAVTRQLYSYGKGCALLRAKHIRIGELPPQSLKQKLSLAKRYCRALIPGPRLMHRTQRWRYAQNAAWCAGSIAGLYRYHAIF